MARAIDAESIMNKLLYGNAYISDELAEYIKQVFDKAPTIEAEPVKKEWVSVKNRLPEFGEKIYCRRNTDTVLAWDGYEYVMGYFTRHSQFDEVEFNGVDEDGNYMVRTPTHWMPLPEPPEGVRK